ncbi:MAG: outer membrane lipoprotein-sorting protein [Deltaproteobacteria bacterium]|nr:outer membrane lipoprotein-sorting protein [Deltaproteobacteria bacterium]
MLVTTFILGASILGNAEGDALLKKADAANNPFADQTFRIKMIVREADGREDERELRVWQKGGVKRRVTFLAPADVRGMSVVIEDSATMYVYLPAFKKVRRIAMHARNATFMGSDFTYDEMAAVRWASDWTAKRVDDDDGRIVLALTGRKRRNTHRRTMKVWLDPKTRLSSKIEYYDTEGRLKKTETRGGLTQIDGVTTQTQISMTDAASGHSTHLTVVDLKVNQGLGDNLFSRRSLERVEP